MKIFHSCRSLITVTIAFLWFALPGFAASSASKNGVTWTFNQNYTTGQYANGDPWVVGPVTITSISPVPTDGRNGTMVNPQIGTSQGFDKDFTYNAYISNLNVGKNLPLTVAVDSSVVSSITADAYTSFNTIEMLSILTVVQNAPASGGFRPPAIGAGSRASLWNESQLDYSKLNTLSRAPLTATPAISNYAEWFSYPWLELDFNWTGRYLHLPYMALNGYGKDMALRTGDAALLLNLDYANAQKRDLLIGLVQAGIDNYGFISQGGSWYNDGGHNLGRLTPVIIAAGVLNDNNLKAVIKGSAMKFQEFQSTFFVSQADVDLTNRTGTNGDPSYPYTVADIGKPEWGIRHTGSPALDNNFYGASYRDINGATHTAPTMAAKVMGLRSTIDWEPLFQYAERHLGYEQSAGYQGEFAYNATPVFHKQFYNAYKNMTLVPPSTNILTSIAVTPSAATIAHNGTQQLTAAAKDQNGTTMSGVALAWVSSNISAVAINSSGLATGTNAGTSALTANITASASGVTSNAVVFTVNAAASIPTFAVGDRIRISNNTNVRNAGALSGSLLGAQNANATGTIVGGPIGKDADNITWWQVNYDIGADGWSGQDNFVKLSGQQPSKPQGLRIVE